MKIGVRTLMGAELVKALDAVADLRIRVFRDFPYLYDGDHAYEARYLATLSDSARAIVVGAFHEGNLIGAATGAPMEDHSDDFSAPLSAKGIAEDAVFYCAESVLLPEFRGLGIGHQFFDLREEQARRLGRTYSAFCAVQRPSDHPLRPADYRPLDGFWRKRGYTPLKGAVAAFSWKDIDQPTETRKPLQFWMRSL